MDGHYSFGEEIAFTEADGDLYDTFIYLYTPIDILMARMEKSERNRKYLKYDLNKWQSYEINSLRKYCHLNNKDFYIIDSPESNGMIDSELALEFIQDVYHGFSCVNFSRKIVDELNIQNKKIYLLDGDKTFCKEDTSRKFYKYKTKIFDNNFYSGFQSWRLHKDFDTFNYTEININDITIRKRFLKLEYKILITSGYPKLWKFVCDEMNIPLIIGKEMCADTKYFITKFLKEKNNYVISYGDSMVDYFMVKEADEGYLYVNDKGHISRSLINTDLGGIKIVFD